MKPEAIAQIEALQAAAVQIQQWDFAGWGNTSGYAADYIAAQDAESVSKDTEIAWLRGLLVGDNGALTSMDLARMWLTEGNPRTECNWGILDTSDIRAALTTKVTK